ncbi:enoyl-CoA hydratase [Natrinema pellirubrum DSM 15624]|uniref:Enoyl-CoA hydratase n=1 Tax=Natrinema pellirubrum (strain DSM 15624 / CIP 106293 / JCM 10476 / NCIMB 786 / 157) TaxID=797303 RepID=L0JL99_NATP1|nr:enoyl-CoA hydratase-related protein [Natrinema pellirubrum]AGB31141.1 enoyl-CoA hydratase/carnithine racemase [Natrinema pellirubrum DSM 15624]ELY81208.1 enoyl-CoA hydratase [Natrinema pellirubrum DSM 15624]
MSWDTVSLEYDDDVATLTVDRPDALNALNVETLEAMGEAIETAADEGARALVLTGAGDAFIAGADIKYMQDLGPEAAQKWGELGHDVADALEAFPAPTIAAVNGYAFGGGCEMALACDLRVAGESALIGNTEIDLGIIPGWGATQRLPRLVGDETARRMIFLGERLDAESAAEAGLFGEVVADDELEGVAAELADRLAAKPAFAMRTAKQAINQGYEGSQESGLSYEKRAFASLFGTPDQREGMAAFVEDREPDFE